MARRELNLLQLDWKRMESSMYRAFVAQQEQVVEAR